MARATTTPKAEADLERLTAKIQATQKIVEQSALEIGEDLMLIYQTQAYKPDTFQEYCEDQFGLLQREIYRYISAFKLVQVTRKHLGEVPRSPKYAERVMGVLANKHPEKLKAVQAQLKKRGVSLATATTPQIAEAVKAVMPRTKRKARKSAS